MAHYSWLGLKFGYFVLRNLSMWHVFFCHPHISSTTARLLRWPTQLAWGLHQSPVSFLLLSHTAEKIHVKKKRCILAYGCRCFGPRPIYFVISVWWWVEHYGDSMWQSGVLEGKGGRKEGRIVERRERERENSVPKIMPCHEGPTPFNYILCPMYLSLPNFTTF